MAGDVGKEIDRPDAPSPMRIGDKGVGVRLFWTIVISTTCNVCASDIPAPKSADGAVKTHGASGTIAAEAAQETANPKLSALVSTIGFDLPTEERDEKGRVSRYAVVLEVLAYLKTAPALSPEEQARVDTYLFDEHQELFGCFIREKEELLRIPTTAIYWRAAAQLATYLTDNAERYSRTEQASIYDHILFDAAFTDNLAPTFDGFAFGLAQFDGWKAAGYPIDDKPVAVSQEFVVCPRRIIVDKKRYNYTETFRGNGCSDEWYDLMMGETTYRKRFADYLTENGDPKMAETVALNLLDADLDTLLALLRDLESNPALWTVAWRTVATHAWRNHRSPAVIAASRRIWDVHPELRATVLWGLAQIDYNRNHSIDWDALSRQLGDKVSEALFGEFLKQDPSSPMVAHLLWPTLTRGWSRADMLRPYMDRWLTDAQANSLDLSGAEHAWRYTIDAMCKEKNHGDLDKMKQLLEARLHEHPDEPFRPWLQYMATRHCGRRARKKRASGPKNSLRINQ